MTTAPLSPATRAAAHADAVRPDAIRTDVTRTDVTTRLAVRADAGQIETMHARCSATSLYDRFHAPLPRVSARLVRQLVAPPGGWSILAEHAGEVVGFACAGALSSFEVEVGLIVEDRHQRKGIGTRLLHETAVEAARRGYQSLQMLTRPENDRVLGTVQGAGLLGHATWQDGLLCVAASVRRLGPAATLGHDLPRPA